MSTKTKKINLRDCLNDNTLDLSMSELEEVPVKDIALIKKGTHLDLSINKIVSLPDDFASLIHLTKLDLSKNQLVSLPMNFGELVHLKHLDLYCNKLENLPVSFGLMKSLRWLDLKDNPLTPAIATIAGQCLDQQQCQTCAKKIVPFMQGIQKQIDEVKSERALEKEQERKSRETVQIKKKKKSGKSKDKKKGENVKAPLMTASGDALQDEPLLEKPVWTEDTKQTKQTSSTSCCCQFIKLTLLFVVLIGLSLATLRVVDPEKYTALQESGCKSWKLLVASLPPQVVETGQRFANATRPAMEIACKQLDMLGVRIQDGYSWLKANELVKHFMVQAKSLWDVSCDWIVIGTRTVCENIPIYIEAVKKMIGL